jgi:hypothetical protein
MSLLNICTNALSELSGIDVPTTFTGNGDLTAKLAVALANREGKTLEKELRWATLVEEYTFTTVSGTAGYAKPGDFRAFANMSQWDRTNRWRLRGPTPSVVWQWLQSGLAVASTNRRWFMVRGATINIFPTPTVTGDTIAFDYFSNKWVSVQATGLTSSTWTADNDTALLDEDLLTLGLKWRFLQAKGMPFQAEYNEYCAIKEQLQADSGARGVINLNKPTLTSFGSNLPESRFGQN